MQKTTGLPKNETFIPLTAKGEKNEEIIYDLGPELEFCFVCKQSAKDFDKKYNICVNCSEKYLWKKYKWKIADC